MSSFSVLLWLIASIVWARGVDQLKRYTSEDVIRAEICGAERCNITTPESYAGLNISLVSVGGFGCIIRCHGTDFFLDVLIIFKTRYLTPNRF